MWVTRQWMGWWPTVSDNGVSAFAAKLDRIADLTKDGAAAGLQRWAEYVLEQSSRQVPIEEGTLQNSGTTAVDDLTGYVGYGTGAAAAYAVIQHEKPMRHDPGRKDHYLSDPAAQSTDVAAEIVAGGITSVLT